MGSQGRFMGSMYGDPPGPTYRALFTVVSVRYIVCMKRTNLVLDAQLLEEATRLSGEKTFSRTVERALEEFVRRIKARQILTLQGSGLWEGDLGEMRRDTRRPARRRNRTT